jgi:transcriptional regulator with XRE-family HTH domain
LTPPNDRTEHPIRDRGVSVRGDFLRSLRLERGWSQKEAATAADLSEKTIRAAEKGDPLDQSTIDLLAKVYRVPGAAIQCNEIRSAADAESGSLSGSAVNAKRYLEGVWNDGKLELIDELFLPEFHFHHESGAVHSREEMRERVLEWRRSFSDIHFAVEQVDDYGEFIACYWHVTAVHSGAWLDLAPTGRRIEFHGSSWAQVVDGLFGDCWDFWDPALLYQQLSAPADSP